MGQEGDRDETGDILGRITYSRRSFFKGLTASGLLAGLSELLRPLSAESSTTKVSGKVVTEPSRKIPVVKEVDVIVVGGGMAGCCGAIAAGRMGLKTIIVEYFGFFGGNATNSLVDSLCGFFTRTENRIPLVKGIGGEIIETLVQRKGGEQLKNCYTIEPELLKLVLDEKVMDAKVEPLFYSPMVSPIIQNNIVKGIVIENKGGRQAILGKMVLDCTGDGDVCALANVPFELGDGKGQFYGVDMGFQLVNVDDKRLDLKDLEALQKEAITSGQYKLTRVGGNLGNIGIPGVHWANMARIPWAVNGTDPYQLTRSVIEGRQIVREWVRFLRDKFPGLENAEIVETAARIGLRETRRVMGEHLLTAEEVLKGTKFDDGIGANAWPIEQHIPGLLERKMFFLKGDDYHTIPYRSLVPKKVENLLMAGRFVSATHDALASIRVSGPAAVMGHAIGTAAALSIKEKVSPRRLKVTHLQKELEKAGAFLG